jgi:hypothetical protein
MYSAHLISKKHNLMAELLVLLLLQFLCPLRIICLDKHIWAREWNVVFIRLAQEVAIFGGVALLE